jgi:hypothetical protein
MFEETLLLVKEISKGKNILVSLEPEEELFNEILSDMDRCIERFNKHNFDFKVYVNSFYTYSILKKKLPDTEKIFRLLYEDLKLKDRVRSELVNSKYFNEVWKITNAPYLFINILVLLYRTTVLFQVKELKLGSAQVSSTIEEMALLLKIEGEKNKVFEATKHWLVNWKSEGFSETVGQLASEQ